jgi:hypothetical protein
MKKLSEATIKIHRTGKELSSISVFMPFSTWRGEFGTLMVSIPLLQIETVARDKKDAEKAIEEAITSFCIASERFGQGIEKELEALGWIPVDGESGERLPGYNFSNTNSVIDRIIKGGETYENPRLQICEHG